MNTPFTGHKIVGAGALFSIFSTVINFPFLLAWLFDVRTAAPPKKAKWSYSQVGNLYLMLMPLSRLQGNSDLRKFSCALTFKLLPLTPALLLPLFYFFPPAKMCFCTLQCAVPCFQIFGLGASCLDINHVLLPTSLPYGHSERSVTATWCPAWRTGHQSRHHMMRIKPEERRASEGDKWERGEAKGRGRGTWRLADGDAERRWDGREVKRRPAAWRPSGELAVWCLTLTPTHDPAALSLFRRMRGFNRNPRGFVMKTYLFVWSWGICFLLCLWIEVIPLFTGPSSFFFFFLSFCYTPV